MADLTLPAQGSCRCGATRFQITSAPLFTAVCHCTGCQKMTGGYAAVVASVLAENFDLLAGAPIQGGLKDPELRHMHCAECLVSVFTEGAKLGGRVNFRPGHLDDASWFIPIMDLWMSEALPGDVAVSNHVFDGWPPKEALPGIAAEFAAKLQVAE